MTQDDCAVAHAFDLIGGKWKPQVLSHIMNGTNRFTRLQRAVPGITKQMLTLQLRELERDGFLIRQAFAEIPPRVEYKLTLRGKTLLPLLSALRDWGQTDMDYPLPPP